MVKHGLPLFKYQFFGDHLAPVTSWVTFLTFPEPAHLERELTGSCNRALLWFLSSAPAAPKRSPIHVLRKPDVEWNLVFPTWHGLLTLRFDCCIPSTCYLLYFIISEGFTSPHTHLSSDALLQLGLKLKVFHPRTCQPKSVCDQNQNLDEKVTCLFLSQKIRAAVKKQEASASFRLYCRT